MVDVVGAAKEMAEFVSDKGVIDVACGGGEALQMAEGVVGIGEDGPVRFNEGGELPFRGVGVAGLAGARCCFGEFPVAGVVSEGEGVAC